MWIRSRNFRKYSELDEVKSKEEANNVVDLEMLKQAEDDVRGIIELNNSSIARGLWSRQTIEKLLWPSERSRLGRRGRLVKNLGPHRQSAPNDPVWVIVQIDDDFSALGA